MAGKVGKTPNYRLRWPEYAKQWDRMKVKPAVRGDLNDFVKRALAGKDRYLAVEGKTGVPWWMIAIIAERESGQNWSRSLAQGDRWDRVSRHVPKGRGPFKSWEAAAVDALHIDHLDDVQDWRLEKTLYYWERYNGWGYHLYHGIPSPYLWGGTSIQKCGKYRDDGKWDPKQWDTQLGAAAMLRALMDADSTIQPIRET